MLEDSPNTQTIPSANPDSAVEYFQKNKYVVVDSAVDPDICEFLAGHMLDLIEQKKTAKDVQCPMSEAIYGDKLFDTLLEDVRPLMEKVTGLRLFPTYSYARKYVPGDELKPHLDRPACEISATLTLGYKGKVWPIHVSRDKDPRNDLGPINIEVGSLVVYRGMEINHFRKPYTEGEWQCQVFLHYVDADGPYKDEKYDSRKALGEASNKKSADVKDPAVRVEQESYYPWIFGFALNEKRISMIKENVLNNLHIDSIINYSRSVELTLAGIGAIGQATVDKKIRHVSHCWLPTDKLDWLYEMLEREIRDVNWINYKYVLTHMEKIDYLEYHGGTEDDEHSHGKYTRHLDGAINDSRKLSFSILLSDPSEYEGGDLIIYDGNDPIVVPRKKGCMTLFPANVPHEVTPVTKGIRRSIVSWSHGPHFC